MAEANFSSGVLSETRVLDVKEYEKCKFDYIIVDSCIRNQVLKRYVQDQVFLAQYEREHKIKYWIWKKFTGCGQAMWQWIF